MNPFCEAHIFERNNNLILIGTSFYYGDLYFWDFENGSLNCKLSLNTEISDICILNNDYILAALNNKNSCEFTLINTNKSKVEKIFEGDNNNKNRICGIKNLKHKSKGQFIITVFLDGKLNLYKINK